MMDYALHESGDFDSITDMWVHAVLVVDPASLKTYDDGRAVPDAMVPPCQADPQCQGDYGFYGGLDESQNAASPSPGNLSPPLAASNTFDLRTDIFLGGRVDRDGDRHFHGTLALFQIYEGPLTDVMAHCVFSDGDAALPEPQASHCTPLNLDLRLIGDTQDRSGNNQVVSQVGEVEVDQDGAHFDGDGDYISVAADGFDYASDGVFSVAFWMSKEECTGGIYEYLYSHAQDPMADIVDVVSSSNVNIYLGCEDAGGGWSTNSGGQQVGGTAVRFNLIDGAQHWGSFDFPLHDAGDFDAITSVWIQLVLVVTNYRLYAYEDGTPIVDSNFAFYAGSMTQNNVAYPHPGYLTATMGGFNLVSDLILGGRSDLEPNRHFIGRLAGVQVAAYDISPDDVQCIFQGGEEYLPAPDFLAGCSSVPDPGLDVSFLPETQDTSGNDRVVTLHGNTATGVDGASFNGSGDYITVSNFGYGVFGLFTISFWVTKQECQGNLYEYVWSHQQNPDTANIFPTDAGYTPNSNINMYIACEGTGGGFSTVEGTVMRVNLLDTPSAPSRTNPNPADETWAVMDYPLHDAGDFDSITNVWVHSTLVVTHESAMIYADGYAVQDEEYGYYPETMSPLNAAHPNPSQLTQPLKGFNLRADIFLGGRSDLNADRHLLGKMANVQVYVAALDADQAECVFRFGESVLPDPNSIAGMVPDCGTTDELDILFIGDYHDRSPNAHTVTLGGRAAVDADGAHFDNQGDFITIENFDYASDGSFSISFWMTKEDCAAGVYEYMYSHAQDPNADIVSVRTSSNINVYLGCEAAGGGWSTSGGTVVRFNLIDGLQQWATFDYPLHDAGDFDAITSVWVQVSLTSGGSFLGTYDDGTVVSAQEYGYYAGDGAMTAANLAYPNPGQLSSAMNGFNLLSDIFLGGRADLNGERHFLGRMAGLHVSSEVYELDAVSCMFTAGEAYLPAGNDLLACQTSAPPQVSILFLSDYEDSSLNHLSVSPHGSAQVTAAGIDLSGPGDYVTVSTNGVVDYGVDGSFTISMWITKEDCLGQTYEYIYSQAQDPSTANIFPTDAGYIENSNVNMYIACDDQQNFQGGGWSTQDGTILRYSMVDSPGRAPPPSYATIPQTWATMDYPLHDAGDFDQITANWINVMLKVSPPGVASYSDGYLVPDTEYGFYAGAMDANNAAYPTPGRLSTPMKGFTLLSDIFIGGRSDGQEDRHFLGRIAAFNIFPTALTDAEAECVFLAGDALLPPSLPIGGR
jgi:hypothetical protein